MMTNDELKKKIMDVINATDISVTLRRDDISTLSDALIAAGIGDVKTAREIGASAAAMAVFEAAKAEHRAEVAERAVYNMAYGQWQREGARRAICEKYAPSTARDYLARAEKELAEGIEK